jgi:acyl-CoA thioesterase-2
MSQPHPDSPALGRDRAPALVARMLALFEFEQADAGLFRAPGMTTEPRRIFGGQLLAQALAAASRTVEAPRRAHYVSATFIRSGVTTSDMELRVERDSDGSTFSLRRVLVTQDGKPLLSLSASFQAPEPGDEHQVAAPAVPAPEELEDDRVAVERMDHLDEQSKAAVRRGSPFEFRSTYPHERFSLGPAEPVQEYWFRAATPLQSLDQAAQRVLLTYASDMMLMGTGMIPHGMRWFAGGMSGGGGSLNHAIWIHDDVQVDDWLLYRQDSPWSGGARNLNRGLIFNRAGRLVATTAQEALVRRRAG